MAKAFIVRLTRILIMVLQGFDKISSNVDILIHIYSLLNVEDQLKLAQVSDTLREIFHNFIWPMNYRILKIRLVRNEYIVSDETDLQRKLLNKRSYEEFQNLYAKHVEELRIKCEVMLILRALQTSLSKEPLFDLTPFRHLKVLRCPALNIERILLVVAKNLPDLISLHLDEYTLGASDVTEIVVENLLKMNKLKNLTLNYSILESQYTLYRVNMKFQYFWKLLSQLQLEVLEGHFKLEPPPDDDDDYDDSTSVRELEELIYKNKISLKKLSISTTSQSQQWSRRYKLYFKIFENLQTLNLISLDKLDDATLSTLSTCCANLTELTIECSSFNKILNFSIPEKVTKFSLLHCKGLNSKNLQQLLSKPHIIEFISHGVQYMFMEMFHLEKISASIERLDIDSLDLHKLSKFCGRKNENVKHLKLYNGKCGQNSEIYKSYTPAILTTSFGNLQTLEMEHECGELPLNSLQQLKHLRLLKTFIDLPSQWSYLGELLKLASLHELIIILREYQNDVVPPKAFATKVKSLKVDYKVYCDSNLEFFLDLFRQNNYMKLSFFCWHSHPKDILKDIVTHPYFKLRKIIVCGFTIGKYYTV